jgi:hypothetical protein
VASYSKRRQDGMKYDLLVQEIRNLGRQKLYRHRKLYRILKVELTKLGHWKNHPRGNPSLGFKKMRYVIIKKSE